MVDVTEYFTHIEKNIYQHFEWRKSSPETMDMFETMFHRIKYMFSVEEFDKLMRLFDCYDPFGSWEYGVVWRMLKLIRYAHWNQYYFANMSDDDLKNLCEQHIKMFKNELEVKLLEKDFS